MTKYSLRSIPLTSIRKQKIIERRLLSIYATFVDQQQDDDDDEVDDTSNPEFAKKNLSW